MQVDEQKPNDFRRAVYAGRLYPLDPVELSEFLEQKILKSVRPASAKGTIRAVVTPFSSDRFVKLRDLGALRSLNRHTYPTVVVVATAQNLFFDFASIYSGGAYDTPLGRVFLDIDLCRQLANLHPRVRMAARGHSGGKDAEYAIECLLPWLQKLVGNFRLVPIIAGSDDSEIAAGIGEVIAHPDLRDALLVACTQVEIPTGDSDRFSKWKRAEAAFIDGEYRTFSDHATALAIPGMAGMLALAYAKRRLGILHTLPIESEYEEGDLKQKCISYVQLGT